MKYLILLLVCMVTVASAQPYFEKLADKIYLVEGGTNTHWPYGIKMHVHNPRAMCVRICQNAYGDWVLVGHPGNYLDYLSSIYCPYETDPVGHRNWRRNIHALMRE